MIWVLLQSESPWNVMTPLRFLFIFVFLRTRNIFKKSLKGVCTMAKFEQILRERFGNILKQSFKNHKIGEIRCYPHK